jgi:hypothetical protein
MRHFWGFCSPYVHSGPWWCHKRSRSKTKIIRHIGLQPWATKMCYSWACLAPLRKLLLFQPYLYSILFFFCSMTLWNTKIHQNGLNKTGLKIVFLSKLIQEQRENCEAISTCAWWVLKFSILHVGVIISVVRWGTLFQTRIITIRNYRNYLVEMLSIFYFLSSKVKKCQIIQGSSDLNLSPPSGVLD